jgi:O-antigen/teichoic acid export membrane protein
LAGGLTAFSPWLIKLVYGQNYVTAVPVLMIHAWAIPFVFLGVARGQFLVNDGLNHVGFWSTAAGAVVNVCLNMALIPGFGGVGAAWATIISYAIASWLSSFLWRKTKWVAVSQTFALLAPWRPCSVISLNSR